MSLNYIQNTTLTGINDLFTFLSDAFVAAGWTRTIINNDLTIPSTAGEVRREHHFESPGDASHAGGLHVGMMSMRDGNNTSNAIAFFTWTGQKVADISDITVSSGVATVTTSANHNFSTGDLVGINGNLDNNYNKGFSGTEIAANTITVTGSTTFTVSMSAPDGSSSGGTAVAFYNMAGSRHTGGSDGLRIPMLDAAVDAYGYLDEFRLALLCQQGGDNKLVYAGATGREHVQTAASDTAKSTEAITGTGAQTIVLDRTPTNMYVGQPIWVVSADSADVEVTTITALSGASLTASFTTAFSAGAVIGWDPLPGVCLGLAGTASDGSNLQTYKCMQCLANDGTRAGVAQNDLDDSTLNYTPYVAGYMGSETTYEQTNDPDTAGFYQGLEIGVLKSNAGSRKYLPGFSAWPMGAQTEYDIHRVGPTPADDDYRVFTSVTVGSSYFLAIGPGAE